MGVLVLARLARLSALLWVKRTRWCLLLTRQGSQKNP